MKQMWDALCRIVLPRLNGRSVCMAFDWPAACSYWQRSSNVSDLDGKEPPHISEVLAGKLRSTALLHGCDHELRATCGKAKGELVRKLWRIDSDCEVLVRVLQKDRKISIHERREGWRRYMCSHGRGAKRVACAGRVTRDAQLYSPDFARVVHVAWRRHVEKVSLDPCMFVLPVRLYMRHEKNETACPLPFRS